MFNRLANRLGYTKKSLAYPDAELLALFGAAGPTASGVSITPTTALQVPAVACSVRAISEAAASLHVKVVEVGEDGTETEVTDHPVAALLRDGPNEWTSGFEFIRDLTAQALIYDGGGLAWVNRVGGRPVEVIQYDPGFIGVERATDGSGACIYRLNSLPLNPADVIHLRSPFGRSPLSLAKEAIGLASTMEGHAARLFGSGAKPSGVLSLKNKATPESVKRMREAWQLAHGGNKSGGTAIVDDGAAFTQLSLNSVDAQFAELRVFQILEIARAFRVPPSMIFEMGRATWSNYQQASKEFIVNTLEPWLRALEGALRRALFSSDEFRRMKIVFERDDLTRADIGERASAINSLIASRVLSPNEGRAWLDLPPRDGGDTFENPNITTAPPAPPNAGNPGSVSADRLPEAA